MSDQTAFGTTSSPEEKDKDVTASQVANAFGEQLSAITREDGTPKYDSIEKALSALKTSQDYIATLEAKNKSSEEKLAEAKSVATMIEEMSAKQNQEKPVENTIPSGGLSREEAVELTKRTIAEEQNLNQAKENFELVNQTLVKRYGEKAYEAVVAKAAEIGSTPDKLKNLAAESPQMVLKLFETGGKTAVSPITSSINISGKPASDNKVAPPEQSLLSGPSANDKNRKEFMAKIKEEVYNRLDVET